MKFSNFIQSSSKMQNQEKKQNFMTASNFSSAQRNNDSFKISHPISSVEVEDLKEEIKFLKREIMQLQHKQTRDIDFEEKEEYTKVLLQKSKNQEKRIAELEDENFRMNQSLAEKDNYILELKSQILKSNQNYDEDTIIVLKNENRRFRHIIEERNMEIQDLKYGMEELSHFKRENNKLKYEINERNKELEDIYSLYYEQMAKNQYGKMARSNMANQYNDESDYYKSPSYSNSNRSFYNNDRNFYND